MGEAEAALELTTVGPGLTLVTGHNGAGKSSAARALAARVEGAQLLSAETQQAFYEAELANDDSNFQEAVDTGTTVGELLGDAGRRHPLFVAFRLEALWDRGYRLLSSGESRKVLLLHAVVQAPSLLVLDDPFDGLDRAACAELAESIVRAAEALPLVVVGTFAATELPFSLDSLREVVVIEARRIVFRGSPQAFLARALSRVTHRSKPPVHFGSFHAALELSPGVPLVDLRKGEVRYGDLVVFAGLDFRVATGAHTLIEGPNGSGKSSLLDMLTGDHPQAYANELYLFGRRRGTGETVWDIKRNVGAVSGRLHRDYRVGGSIEEVLLSGLYDSIGVYEKPEPSHRARARAWLDWLEVGLAPTASFRELSFGQQRLVLIARAAIKLPPLLVLDEPTSGLDSENRAHVLELVESLCTQRLSTVLMVTHRVDERDFWQQRIGGAILSLPMKTNSVAADQLEPSG
ncbi:MAG TPA: ATP-binding cassette domain-containing protein [Polyangiaceae bacterium]|nr:ATP-binding cassette domain-containing protein [Polyangiaceae bacterium]